MMEDEFEQEQSYDWNDRDSSEIILPEFTKWNSRKVYDFENIISDYDSMEKLNHAITAARQALFKLNDGINKYEQEERAAKLAYDRAFRRAYLQSNEKTDSAKRSRAALKCEGLENAWITSDQIKNELVRMSFSMKSEIQILQTIANNLRQQLKMM